MPGEAATVATIDSADDANLPDFRGPQTDEKILYL